MARPIREDVKELLGLLEPDNEQQRRARTAGATIGAVVGAAVGFAVILGTIALFGGDADSGVAAILFGVPGGAWAGAEIGAREGSRR